MWRKEPRTLDLTIRYDFLCILDGACGNGNICHATSSFVTLNHPQNLMHFNKKLVCNVLAITTSGMLQDIKLKF